MATLLDLIPGMKRVSAGARGVEFHGPCPWQCGADHDGFHIWTDCGDRRDNYWCRSCERAGDDIQFCREFYNDTYPEACARLGSIPAARPFHPPPALPSVPDTVAPPPLAWQRAAAALAGAAYDALWSDAGAKPRYWLHQRGLTDDTIALAGLGYLAQDTYVERAAWGLEPITGNDGAPYTRLKLPRGILFPTEHQGAIWRLAVRRPSGSPKYHTIAGSANLPYGVDGIAPGAPLVITEGPIDALAVLQTCETPDAHALASAIAVGTTGARRLPWVLACGRASVQLVALDSDGAGQQFAGWWLDMLAPTAHLWPPTLKDPADMLQHGEDVRQWVCDGLEAALDTMHTTNHRRPTARAQREAA